MVISIKTGKELTDKELTNTNTETATNTDTDTETEFDLETELTEFCRNNEYFGKYEAKTVLYKSSSDIFQIILNALKDTHDLDSLQDIKEVEFHDLNIYDYLHEWADGDVSIYTSDRMGFLGDTSNSEWIDQAFDCGMEITDSSGLDQLAALAMYLKEERDYYSDCEDFFNDMLKPAIEAQTTWDSE